MKDWKTDWKMENGSMKMGMKDGEPEMEYNLKDKDMGETKASWRKGKGSMSWRGKSGKASWKDGRANVDWKGKDGRKVRF